MNKSIEDTNGIRRELLSDLVFEDMLAIRELPSFTHDSIASRDEQRINQLLADVVRELVEQRLVTIFEVVNGDPDSSSTRGDLRLPAQTVRELLEKANWTTSKLPSGNELWIAATEKGEVVAKSELPKHED